MRLVVVLSGLGVVALMLNVMTGDVVKRYYTTIARAGLGFWLAVFAEIVFAIGLAICTKKGSVKNSRARNADINNDGTVNMRDIQIAILNFNKHE